MKADNHFLHGVRCDEEYNARNMISLAIRSCSKLLTVTVAIVFRPPFMQHLPNLRETSFLLIHLEIRPAMFAIDASQQRHLPFRICTPSLADLVVAFWDVIEPPVVALEHLEELDDWPGTMPL
jgi:hypothetical protein